MICLMSTVCIFSMTIITYTYLSNMAFQTMLYREQHCVRALNWPWISRISTHKWHRHTSHCDVMNRYYQSDAFAFNHDCLISILNFPVIDLCFDSMGDKLFGFVFSRSYELIVINVCGTRSADRDHRIVSEPIVNGLFLESGPVHQQWSYHSLTPSHCCTVHPKHTL